MKKLFLILMLLPAICLADDPTATPTETPTPTPTPVVRANPISTSVTIGTGSTRVISAESLAYMQELIVCNDSDEAIYLNIIGGDAVLNAGIRLNASGGSITWIRDKDYFPAELISAICASGSKKLLVSAR